MLFSNQKSYKQKLLDGVYILWICYFKRGAGAQWSSVNSDVTEESQSGVKHQHIFLDFCVKDDPLILLLTKK